VIGVVRLQNDLECIGDDAVALFEVVECDMDELGVFLRVSAWDRVPVFSVRSKST
jgi:hypothetical protein